MQPTDSGVKCLRRVVAAAITPDVFQVLQENYQVTILTVIENLDGQAGLEDFDYMEKMTSVAQLKEQIVVTGAEVCYITFTFLEI